MARSNLTEKERVEQLTKNNRIWYQKYVDLISQDGKPYDTINEYSNVILNLLELDITKDINEVEFKIFKDYILETKKETRCSFKMGRIKSFLTIVSEDAELKFDIDTLDELKEDIKKIGDDRRRATPYTIKTILKIRNILKNDILRLFVFEMIFQYGLTLDELAEISEDLYDEDTSKFTFSSKQVIATDKIKQLIILKPFVLNKKKRSRYQDIIGEISSKVNERIIWSDIVETRNQYFIRCSLCNELFENTSENMALLQYEDDVDKSKWIVCRGCAMRGGSNG